MHDGFFCLKCVHALQDLTDEEIMEISSSVHESEYDSGELVYIPSESQGKVFFLREGEVDIYHKSSSGKKIIVNTLQAGDMFGDVYLVPSTQETQGNFARAASKARVCVVDKVEFMDYLQRKPKIALRIIEELSQRLTRSESQVRDLALNTVSIRLFNELQRLGKQYGEQVKSETLIRKHFTHEELANRISATRETVTKVMGDLEHKHFLRYDDDRNILLNSEKMTENL